MGQGGLCQKKMFVQEKVNQTTRPWAPAAARELCTTARAVLTSHVAPLAVPRNPPEKERDNVFQGLVSMNETTMYHDAFTVNLLVLDRMQDIVSDTTRLFYCLREFELMWSRVCAFLHFQTINLLNVEYSYKVLAGAI